jgi:carboxy-terminal domain RNA polymerase II polypeptide A small phosphatase
LHFIPTLSLQVPYTWPTQTTNTQTQHRQALHLSLFSQRISDLISSRCAQDSKGTNLTAAATVTQPATPQDSQNDAAQASQGTSVPQHAHAELPNGAVNASGDLSATASAPSASAPPAPAATGGNDVAASNASTSKVKADETEKATKDAEKDRASVNTSTHTYARSQSTRQKETKSVSELAHTASVPAAQEPKKSKMQSKKSKAKSSKKSSLFSRLFQVFVPCVGPSSKAHPTEVDIEKPRPVEPAAPQADLKEKQVAKEAEELPPKPSTSEAPAVEDAPKQPERDRKDSSPVPPPLQPVDVPPHSDDPAVVVPPTPTKSVLPREEGGGVLSGSVQPIGSTGEDIPHEHRHRDSDRDSDTSTSFIDDEDVEEPSPIDEVEDEEERLILNGGAGIPVGPVSISTLP